MMTQDWKLIGVCLSTIQMEDRLYFIKALNQHAAAHGFRLIVFNSCSDFYITDDPAIAGETAVFRLIPYEKLSAMVLMPHFLSNIPMLDTVAAECRKRNIPVISIDKEMEGCACFSFSYANIFAELCRHVIDVHGAKNLMMMAGTKAHLFSAQRVAAFRQVLKERGLYYDDSLIGYGNFWHAPAIDQMKEWFEEEERPYPDAIICANDTMAIAVSTYLQKHGCRVPEDCIVTGFDGIVQAGYHMPHLTTCRQDYSKMGSEIIRAAETLLAGKPFPEHSTIGFHLICSQSCGCERVSFSNINDATQDIFNRLQLARQRQEMMCKIQSAVARTKTVSDLPAALFERFALPTNIVAINQDMFQPPAFGMHHRDAEAFTKQVNVLYQRYFWYQLEQTVIPISELVPRWDLLLSHEEPIIVSAVHFLDLALGYSVFQPEINSDEYEKVHTFMCAINASLGMYHGQMQIHAMNQELQHVNQELESLHRHDYLTGLYNRRGFSHVIRKQLAECPAEGMQIFLVSADLDRLKYINDTFGHAEGDQAICTIADALKSSAAEHDICARFGGDEFVVGGILPDSLTETYFMRFRKRFGDFLAEYNRTAEKPYPVEASIGFYAEPVGADTDLDRLIRCADDQMYADKATRKKQRQK